MRRTTVAFLVIFAFFCDSHVSTAERLQNENASEGSAPRDGAYQIVWVDEFDRDGPPNPSKWNFEQGFVRNEELQYYQSDNARCKDGLLVIEARREQVRNLSFSVDSKDWRRQRPEAQFTSSCVTTRGLHSWMYGRFEVRARIDARAGLWPAIWTVGDEGPWPECGEIDIMEFYRGNILANACWSSGKRWKPKWDSSRKSVAELGGEEWASQFHTWRMDWTEKSIKLYVDATLLNTIPTSPLDPESDQPYKAFHQPHHLLLNLAIGGSNGGDPSQTRFPAKFEVDFVRVFQR